MWSLNKIAQVSGLMVLGVWARFKQGDFLEVRDWKIGASLQQLNSKT